MTSESQIIAKLRSIAANPASRGLLDDAAVLPRQEGQIVLTTDTMVEGVHFLSGAPADAVGWKLAAVNLSDLAAKGATPTGCLLNYSLSGNGAWDNAFVEGLSSALEMFEMPLLGGDTVSSPEGAPRSLTLTAIGTVPAEHAVPDRRNARIGDDIWVSGTIGDAGHGLRLLLLGEKAEDFLIERHLRPTPRLELGAALLPHTTAMMDVSDGLLLDAQRMASASNIGMTLMLENVPLSDSLKSVGGGGPDFNVQAATLGDDYELLFTAAPHAAVELAKISETLNVKLSCIGQCHEGKGLSLKWYENDISLPSNLGYQHS